jgi:hypothetical protein
MTQTIAAAEFSLATDEFGPLLVDRWAAERWSRGTVDPTQGGPCRLVDSVGTTWLGHVDDIDPAGSITLQLVNPYDPGSEPVSYRCATREVGGDEGDERDGPPRRRARVEVTADAVPDERARRLWQTVIGRLDGMVAEIRGRRTPVQAVVVIHGIGEQLPGRTLEGFVETISATAGSPVWNQADRVSDSYELRQLTLAPSDRRPRTTFYEYYWANEVDGTTTGDVLGWLWSIMGRPPWAIPARLRAAWGLLWGLVVAVTVTAVTVWNGLEQVWWISGAVTFVLAIGASFLIRYLGDAARYLSPRPRNVAIREAIRRRGVDLVRELHQSGRYHRIVLVGHSLGSVVAYDIITHLWPELQREHLRPERASFRAIRLAHDGDGDRSPHSLQAAVWREMRRNTQPWLVTDLVTLGSPLAHAHLLLARTADEFRDKCDRAELPVAPPIRNNAGERFSHERPYRTRSTRSDRTFTFLNESSPFAAVRWTNLYFPARWGLLGDAVGGPVAPVFGEWVLDVPLREGMTRWKRRSLLSHTAYWRAGRRRGSGSEAHVEELRRAIGLDSMKRLGEEAVKHDPLLYCRTRD